MVLDETDRNITRQGDRCSGSEWIAGVRSARTREAGLCFALFEQAYGKKFDTTTRAGGRPDDTEMTGNRQPSSEN